MIYWPNNFGYLSVVNISDKPFWACSSFFYFNGIMLMHFYHKMDKGFALFKMTRRVMIKPRK